MVYDLGEKTQQRYGAGGAEEQASQTALLKDDRHHISAAPAGALRRRGAMHSTSQEITARLREPSKPSISGARGSGAAHSLGKAASDACRAPVAVYGGLV